MNCEHYNEWLCDAVDGNLTAGQQAEIDAHSRTCRACRELLNDLREIRMAAATLERYSPSPATWQAIAAKIRPAASASHRPSRLAGWAANLGRKPGQPSWSGLAAAAALTIILGGAAWFGIATTWKSAPRQATSVDLARSAASELQLAEQHYLNAIATLEKLTIPKDSSLDPAVAAEIAQSLQSIDRAIDDSRAALKAEPDSFIAQTSLLEALRMKVALLQETVSLMNARS
jgi:hypothetical protein